MSAYTLTVGDIEDICVLPQAKWNGGKTTKTENKIQLIEKERKRENDRGKCLYIILIEVALMKLLNFSLRGSIGFHMKSVRNHRPVQGYESI